MKCKGRVRVYTGKRFPSFVPCSKDARVGHDTCWSHRNWKPGEEGAAQLKTLRKSS